MDDDYRNDYSEATEEINLGDISYDDYIDEYHSDDEDDEDD